MNREKLEALHTRLRQRVLEDRVNGVPTPPVGVTIICELIEALIEQPQEKLTPRQYDVYSKETNGGRVKETFCFCTAYPSRVHVLMAEKRIEVSPSDVQLKIGDIPPEKTTGDGVDREIRIAKDLWPIKKQKVLGGGCRICTWLKIQEETKAEAVSSES